MQNTETGPHTSLFYMRALRTQDGSSLPLARHMRGNEELQGLSSVPDLHIHILLGLLCGDLDLALERSV